MSISSQLHPATKAVLLAFALVLLGLLFQELISLMIAILITVLIAIPISTMADKLEEYKIPRPVGAALALFVGLAVVAAVLALVIPSFAEQAETFVEEVPSTVDLLEEQIGGLVGANPGDVGDQIQGYLEQFTEEPARLIGPLASFGLSLLGIVGALILILLTALYIAISPRPLVNGFLSLFPPNRRQWATGVMDRLRDAWIGWMQGVLVDMVISGVLLYLGLSLLGLDFAVVFAVFSALLVVIPYFGAILGGLPPVLYALTDSPELALLVLLVYTLVQQVESNLTIPLVMAQRVKLHPAVVAIGVIIVGQLFGFLGLFVAVPILALIVILVDEIWVKPMEAERGLQTVGDGPPEDLGPGALLVPSSASTEVPEDRPEPSRDG